MMNDAQLVNHWKERAEKAEADLAEARREMRQHVQQRITTRCPSCGHQSLFIGSGGHLTCSWLECKGDPGLERAIEKLKAELAEAKAAFDAQTVNVTEAARRLSSPPAPSGCPNCGDGRYPGES